MRAAFIPALPPSALLAGMIAPSFRLVNRFCGKSYCARAAAVSGRPRCAVVRTCGRRERPHALCAVFSWYPLAHVKGSLPFDRSLWHGPPLRRTQTERALRATEGSKKRGLPHPAAFPAEPGWPHPAASSPPGHTDRTRPDSPHPATLAAPGGVPRRATLAAPGGVPRRARLAAPGGVPRRATLAAPGHALRVLYPRLYHPQAPACTPGRAPPSGQYSLGYIP